MWALEVRAGTPAAGCTTQDAAGFLAGPTETELKRPREGGLGGTAVERLPLAQGVIPAFRDQAPHQAPPLGA